MALNLSTWAVSSYAVAAGDTLTIMRTMPCMRVRFEVSGGNPDRARAGTRPAYPAFQVGLEQPRQAAVAKAWLARRGPPASAHTCAGGIKPSERARSNTTNGQATHGCCWFHRMSLMHCERVRRLLLMLLASRSCLPGEPRAHNAWGPTRPQQNAAMGAPRTAGEGLPTALRAREVHQGQPRDGGIVGRLHVGQPHNFDREDAMAADGAPIGPHGRGPVGLDPSCSVLPTEPPPTCARSPCSVGWWPHVGCAAGGSVCEIWCRVAGRQAGPAQVAHLSKVQHLQRLLNRPHLHLPQSCRAKEG
jgi:hypothetical protein